MKPIYQSYTDEIKEHLNYLATWQPNVELRVGDIGIIKRRQFERISNLSELEIDFEIQESGGIGDMEYASSGGVSVVTKLAGEAPLAGMHFANADAGFLVKFGKENAILLRTNDCKSYQIKDQIALEKIVMEKFKQYDWKKEWRIITELISANSATILISNSNNGSIEIQAKSDITLLEADIANAEAGLNVTFHKDIATKIIAQGGLTPLFKVRGVRKTVFSKPKFREKSVSQNGPVKNTIEIAFEEMGYED